VLLVIALKSCNISNNDWLTRLQSDELCELVANKSALSSSIGQELLLFLQKVKILAFTDETEAQESSTKTTHNTNFTIMPG